MEVLLYFASKLFKMKHLFDLRLLIDFLVKKRNYLIIIFLIVRFSEFVLDLVKGDGDGSITSFYPYMLLTTIKLTLLIGFISLSIIKYVTFSFQPLTVSLLNKLHFPFKISYFFILTILYVSFSVYYNQGGFLEPESEFGPSENGSIGYIRHYLSEDYSFWKKIFDVNITDNGAFQSRELSFVIDFIDCQFIDWCVGLGIPHFYSLSYYIFLVLMGWLVYHFCSKVFQLPTFLCLSLVVILWTSPCLFFSTYFYRSAKISTSFFMLWYFMMIYQILENKDYKASIWQKVLLFIVPLAVTFTDRQGFFFMLLVLLFLGFRWISLPQKKTAYLLFSCLGAVLINQFYNDYLGGKLIFYFNGYYPDFSYQTIPWKMLTDWWSYQDLIFFSRATYLLLQEWRLLLGNIPTLFMFLLAIAFIWIFAKNIFWKIKSPNSTEEKSMQGIAGAFMLVLFVAIIILNLLMIMRHPAMYQEGYFRLYYPIPVTVVLFIISMWVVYIVKKHELLKINVLYFIVLLITLSNVFALSEHDTLIRSKIAPRERRMRETPVFLEGLRNLNNPNYQISDSLANRPIFKFFKERHTKK